MRLRDPVWAVLTLGLMIATAARAEPTMPFAGSKQHLGVSTCAGANCHGRNKPFENSAVLQNEYFTWESKDAHSNAYKLLLSDASKRIGANLGIKAPQEARECLVCHSDFVPEVRRGRRYQYSDGVGCEACHGGAESWLDSHVSSKATHADNVAAGLFPLEDPAARARVCLHCHLGSEERPIDHRIMGAGHPPLVFELDTFTAIQPAHYKVDADYRKRKPYAPGLKTWAAGQLAAARFALDGILSPRFTQDGLFPELVFFDCNACHHPMKPQRWNPGLAGPLGPGEVRLADAALANTGHVLAALLPARAAEWQKLLSTLHASSKLSVARVKEAARGLREIAVAAEPELAARAVRREDAVALIGQITRYALEQDSGDFTAAQQTSMALDAISSFLGQEYGMKPAGFKSALDTLFAAVDTRVNYDPAKFRAAIAKVRDAAPR